MNSFNDFGIKPICINLRGDKIRIERVLGIKIIIEGFRIEDSKIRLGTKCVYIQASIDNTPRVIFSGSKYLVDMIQRVDPGKFPFTTTIIKQENRLEFT